MARLLDTVGGVPNVVYIRNVGDRPYRVMHNKQPFLVQPGAESMVPWEAASSLLGDPRAQNTPQRRFRRELFDRTRGQHNFYLGFDTETRAESMDKYGRPDCSWESKRPPLEVYNQDHERIFMLLDDPDGDHANPWRTPEPVPVDSSIATMEAEIRRLQAQMQVLMNQIASAQTPHDLVVAISGEPPSRDAGGPPPSGQPRIKDPTELLDLTAASLPSVDDLFTDPYQNHDPYVEPQGATIGLPDDAGEPVIPPPVDQPATADTPKQVRTRR